MHFLDWILTAIPLLAVGMIGIYTRRYMKSVAHFLSGGRLAGRYLLMVAGGELQAGAAVFVALFELIAHAGYTVSWWGAIGGPISLIVTISGFVIYRYRETRALTLAQFFEIRYNKSFRLLTGVLGFIAGTLNFGIIPAVGARFLVYFWQLPQTITLFSVNLPTYIPLMALFLGVSLFITLSGGVITLMITNCIEGIISQLFYLILIFALLSMFRWSQISEVFGHRPPHQSLLNPFDSAGIKDFNLWYVLMSICVSAYGTMAWQNASSFNAAAASPHELRMGGILSRWRELGKGAVIGLLGVCAVTFLHHPDFATRAVPAIAAVNHIQDSQIQEQMRVPIGLSYLLPEGVKGIFCALILMGVFGGDATALHSWGSIFVQDILVPLRKKPFEPDQHIRLLRWSIAGVAAFAFLFGILFHQTEYILMWWSVTTAVYVGGAGSAIIGGLYWKKGTTAGAVAALFTGSALCVGGILAREFDSAFPLNGMQISFFTMLVAIVVYVLVSLLTHREDFNMERMLHRGIYAVAVSPSAGDAAPRVRRNVWLGRLIGIDENFTLGDKWIAGGILGWMVLLLVGFFVVSGLYLGGLWPDSAWSAYWHVVGVGVPITMAALMSVWFTWGGLRDMRHFFRRLREQKVNHLDDGTVVGHRNLDELNRDDKG
jgi:SSS family solute:Na+ symporter